MRCGGPTLGDTELQRLAAKGGEAWNRFLDGDFRYSVGAEADQHGSFSLGRIGGRCDTAAADACASEALLTIRRGKDLSGTHSGNGEMPGRNGLRRGRGKSAPPGRLRSRSGI